LNFYKRKKYFNKVKSHLIIIKIEITWNTQLYLSVSHKQG